MVFKYNVDNNLNYKSLLEKIDLEKNNGFYIYGKAGVGKTTFSKEIFKLYEKEKEKLKSKINELDEEYNKQHELYQKRLVDNNITRTSWDDAKNKYGSLDKFIKAELSFPENLKMNEILEEKEKIWNTLNNFTDPVFCNMQKFISDIQASWSKKNSDATQIIENNINIFANSVLLIIDDLGVEFIHESTYPYIYELLEKRFENLESNKLTTIITSNYSIENIKIKYMKKINDDVAVDRLFSRINGLLDKKIEFVGSDKRTNKF